MFYTTTQIFINGRIYITCDLITITEIWGKITGKAFPRKGRRKLRKAYIEFLDCSRGFAGGELELFHEGKKLDSITLKHKL